MSDLTLQEKVEEWIFKNRRPISLVLLGFLLLGLGLFFLRAGFFETTKVEVIKGERERESGSFSSENGNFASTSIMVEVAGAVEKPGVYKLDFGSRVEDVLIKAGGLSAIADREWANKNLNRAAKLADGQKVYIPSKGSQESRGGGGLNTPNLPNLINLNSASLSELDSLSGIGAVRAQAIIDNRPYSSVEELLLKKVVPKSVFEKIKGQVVAP